MDGLGPGSRQLAGLGCGLRATLEAEHGEQLRIDALGVRGRALRPGPGQELHHGCPLEELSVLLQLLGR